MTSLKDRIAGPILCLVTDIEAAGSVAALTRIVREAVGGGVNMVQVRGHELTSDALEDLASKIVGEVGDDAVVVVNGSPGIAEISGAAGAHYPENTELDHAARNSELLIGQSVHSLKSAIAAENAGFDYLVLGTIFPSRSHPGGITGGTELVRIVSSSVKVPVIGIGGITAENAQQVMQAGASGIAVIGAIIGAEDAVKAARQLASAINFSS